MTGIDRSSDPAAPSLESGGIWIEGLRALFALLVFAAIGWQLGIHVRLGLSVVNFFSYFTNLANLFAALVLFADAARHFLGRGWTFPNTQARFASAVNMTVVGIVFAILLRDVDLGSLRPWVNALLHYVMPCVVIGDWLLRPPGTWLGAKQLGGVLVFPALYLGYVLIRGNVTGWYPYPFLNPAVAGGQGAVALYATAIAGTFLLAGWAMMALAHLGRGRSIAWFRR